MDERRGETRLDRRLAPKGSFLTTSGGLSMSYGIIGWIVVGLIAGALAKWIMPGKDPGGIIVTILIGIAGGLLGGFIGSHVGIGGNSNLVNILVATGGAILLLFVYRLFRNRSA
jgi:uncharacterized membrane protein YeaQ/YmgE (transglycosylase-associated protein family)